MRNNSEIAKRVDLSKCDERIMRAAMLAFIAKRGEVSMNTLCKWFSASPAWYVRQELDKAAMEGLVSIRRNGISRRAGYVYAVEAPQEN